MSKSRMNGKRMLGLGVVLTILTAGIIWQVTAPEGQAQSVGGFNNAILIVELTAPELTELTTGAVQGTITAVSSTGRVFSHLTGEDVGIVRIWGFKTLEDGVTVSTLNANFELPGYNGTLAAQGTLVDQVVDAIDRDNVVAITGGTGTFRGATGEATIQNNGDGTFTVRLKEGKRK